VISNICAAKSKFLKKEKYYAPMMKLKLRIFMMSKTLLKKLMINFEIIILINFIT
jgi:intein-encoded DNA endonuclease-like protein